MMKRVILILVIVAVVAIVAVKLVRRRQAPVSPAPPTSTSSVSAQNKPTLYLFRDPFDNDAGCRRIYEYADRAERELAGRVDVRRPDVEREKNILAQYQVRVLPTILLVSSKGEVQERFEGEGNATAQRIEQTLQRLKETAQ